MTARQPPTVEEAEAGTGDPVQADYDRAVNLFASGHSQEADALLGRVLSREPQRHGALHLRGVIAAMQGDAGRGVELIQAALELDGDNAVYWGNLGTALKKLGWLHEAAEAFGRAMALDPQKSEFATSLGLALEGLGKTDEALAAHRLALQKNPSLAPAAYNLGRFLAEQGKSDQAIELLRQAIESNPRYLRAYNELGVIFQARGEREAALATFQAALDVDPAALEPLGNLCLMHAWEDRFDEVERLHQRALQAAPEQADVHVGYGLLQLRRGRLAEGWSEYAWRWKSAQGRALAQRYPLPVWDGGALGDDSLLVWAEQGLAEQLLFSTLLPDLAWQGGEVTLACDAGLVPLVERSFERLRAVPQDDVKDVADHFDCQIPLGDLPRLFRSAESGFSKRSASLMADADRVAELGALAMRKAKGRLLVGLALQGPSGVAEGPPDEAWLPLLETPGCRFIALQPGPPAPALAAKGLESLDEAPVDWAGDLDGLAAQMAAYDLIIAADETAAHLAGALGVRAWVVLPKLPSWCWMLERDDSPWHPSLRLFRQERVGDWTQPVARLADALGRFAASGAA